MRIDKCSIHAIISVLFISIVCASNAAAQTTTADFLQWGRSSQDAFLQNSLSMAGVIASQTNPEIGRCLDEWYFTDAALREMRNGQILDEMQNLQEYLPQAVLLAIIEDVCGRYPRN